MPGLASLAERQRGGHNGAVKGERLPWAHEEEEAALPLESVTKQRNKKQDAMNGGAPEELGEALGPKRQCAKQSSFVRLSCVLLHRQLPTLVNINYTASASVSDLSLFSLIFFSSSPLCVPQSLLQPIFSLESFCLVDVPLTPSFSSAKPHTRFNTLFSPL